MKNLIKLSIADALSLMQKKEITPLELIDAHIAQAEQYSHLNNYITHSFDLARTQAKKAQENYQNNNISPLQGIPVGVKDLFCTKNIRTTAASKMLSDFIPSYESTVSQKLADQGAIMIGKTNMDEFAMGSSNATSFFGNAINPWTDDKNTQMSPGGSSGGSAAAVSSFTAMGSLGSDTGGSVRQPASLSGVVGIKPTYGRCSRFGMISFASSLDQAGVFGRSVADAAIILQSVMGFDPNDSTSLDVPSVDIIPAIGSSIKGMSIGVPFNLIDSDAIDPDVKIAWQNSIEFFKNEGLNIIDISIPYMESVIPIYYTISTAEAASNLGRYDGVKYGYRTNQKNDLLEDLYYQTRSEGFGDEVKRRIITGTYVLSANHINAYYNKAQKLRKIITAEFSNLYQKIDAILMPSTPTVGFALNNLPSDPVEMYMADLFTIPASLAGLPASSVPVAISTKGLPIGMQIVTKSLDEFNLIKISSALEKSASHFNFTPKGF